MGRSPLRAIGHPIRVRSAAVDRRLTHAETRTEMRRDPIVILSLGKTGTTSMAGAMRRASGRGVVKAHATSAHGIAARIDKETALGVIDRPHFWWRNQAVAAELRRPRRQGRWDIVSGVRDPIALAVSDHFYGRRLQADAGVVTSDVDHAGQIEATIRRLFIEQDWFVDELQPVTGIDVYAGAAPTDVVENDRFRVLVTRFEDLSSTTPGATARFLGLDHDLTIPHRNESDRGDGRSEYGRFLAESPLDPTIVDAAYETPLARRFYTDDERAAFRARWTGVLR